MLLCARHSRRPPQIPTLQSCSLYYCGQIVYPIYKHPYSSAAQQSAEPFVTTCQTQVSTNHRRIGKQLQRALSSAGVALRAKRPDAGDLRVLEAHIERRTRVALEDV